jgi:hypothetical protein
MVLLEIVIASPEKYTPPATSVPPESLSLTVLSVIVSRGLA